MKIFNKYYFKKFLLSVFTLLFISSTVYAISFKEAGESIDDTVIVGKIKTKFLADKDLSVFDINVSSKGGFVTLKGELENSLQYEKVILLAESVDNVKSVNTENLLVTDNNSALEDTLITAKVKGRLIKAKLLDENHIDTWKISVTTDNGVVSLSGKVSSEGEKLNVITIVNGVDGVKGINSQELIIKK